MLHSSICKLNPISERQTRGLDFLTEYDFEIHPMPGKDNVVADALSRRPDYYTPQSEFFGFKINPLELHACVVMLESIYATCNLRNVQPFAKWKGF